MSYALHIWEQPDNQVFPTTVEAADRLVKELRNTQPGQNPGFIVLAGRLTRRFPCICSPEAENLSEAEWAWSDGPLDGKTEAAVYSIGLNLERLDEVRPFVLQQARALGLNVMDEQAGEAHLADGKVLCIPRPAAAAEPEKDYDDVPTRAAMVKIVFERVAPVLAKHGFKARKSDASFKRTFPGGWQEISIASGDMWPLHAAFSFCAKVRLHAVLDLIASIAWPDLSPEEFAHRSAGFAIQSKWMDDIGRPFQDSDKCYAIKSYSEIDGAMDHVLMKLETRLLPTLEKCKTIEGLDEVLNPVPVKTSIFFDSYHFGSAHIITAYLAKNPNLAQLCREFDEGTARNPYACHSTVDTRKCIEYVRAQTDR